MLISDHLSSLYTEVLGADIENISVEDQALQRNTLSNIVIPNSLESDYSSHIGKPILLNPNSKETITQVPLPYFIMKYAIFFHSMVFQVVYFLFVFLVIGIT